MKTKPQTAEQPTVVVTRTKPRKALRKPAVLERCGISNTKLYGLIKTGQFPRPHKISERLVAWDEAEIDQWLAAKFAA